MRKYLKLHKFEKTNYDKARRSLPEIKDRNRNIAKVYMRKRRAEDPKFAMKCRLRTRVRNAFKRFTINGKIKPSRDYGIDYEAIIKHLGPCPGNFSEYHIDHIKPLCLFDFGDKNQIEEAFAPENHQWLLASENLKKSAKYNSV